MLLRFSRSNLMVTQPNILDSTLDSAVSLQFLPLEINQNEYVGCQACP